MLRLVRQQVRGFIGREAKRAHISLNVALKVHYQESTIEEYARRAPPKNMHENMHTAGRWMHSVAFRQLPNSPKSLQIAPYITRPLDFASTCYRNATEEQLKSAALPQALNKVINKERKLCDTILH